MDLKVKEEKRSKENEIGGREELIAEQISSTQSQTPMYHLVPEIQIKNEEVDSQTASHSQHVDLSSVKYEKDVNGFCIDHLRCEDAMDIDPDPYQAHQSSLLQIKCEVHEDIDELMCSDDLGMEIEIKHEEVDFHPIPTPGAPNNSDNPLTPCSGHPQVLDKNHNKTFTIQNSRIHMGEKPRDLCVCHKRFTRSSRVSNCQHRRHLDDDDEEGAKAALSTPINKPINTDAITNQPDELELTSHILQACQKYLVGDQLKWAMDLVHRLASQGLLRVKDPVEINSDPTSLVQNGNGTSRIPHRAARSLGLPSKRCRTIGTRQGRRREIEYMFSCFESLAETGDPETFPLCNIFEQKWAEELAYYKEQKGKKKKKQAKYEAQDAILPSLQVSVSREDLIEFLIYKDVFPLNRILPFLLIGILKEKKCTSRKSHSSLEADLFKLMEVRAGDHQGIQVKDIQSLSESKGLTSKVITKFGLYLNTINEDIQVFHSHCFFAGDHKLTGHFREQWVFSTYLKDLDKKSNAFVFFVLESDSVDLFRPNLYILVGRKGNKRIFCIDMKREGRTIEIEVLAQALDHYCSCGQGKNPWNPELEIIQFPQNKSDKAHVGADYALLCAEYFVTHGSTDFPEFYNCSDYEDFRNRLLNILNSMK